MASPTTKISGTTLTLSQRLTAGGADTSFTVSKLSTDVFTVTSGVLKVGVGTNSEWIYFGACSVSSTSITFTSCVRGLKKNATSTSDNDTALQYDHAIGAPVEYVLHSVDINTYVQRNADETITGSLDFSGTSTFKLKLPRYTTAQRDALATADGIIIYNTTAGEAQYCSGGSWYTFSAGSTQPLATEAVYGRVRLNEAAADPAQPIVPGINSTRILDSTSSSSTGAIRVAKETTGSRAASISLHGDDTYTSGGLIVERANTGVNAATTVTHRGTGQWKFFADEDAPIYFNTLNSLRFDRDLARAFTAGETLVAGNFVYVKQSDSKVYKADYSTVEKSNVVGVVITGGSANDTVFVQMGGVFITSGLTAGSTYWVSNTGGAITATTPSMVSSSIVPVQVGFAMSTTELYLRFKRIPRRVPFRGSRTNAEGNGSETITVGFTMNYVQVFSSGIGIAVEGSSGGTYDAVANTNKGLSDDTNIIYYADSTPASLVATGSISGTDFVLTFTKTGTIPEIYYTGIAHELI